MSSKANAWRNFSTVSASTVVSGVSRMLKKPKSPLTDALVIGLDDGVAEDDTTSVTAGRDSGAGNVVACSRIGRTPETEVPKRLREGTRNQEGIEGIPTDHPLPVAASFGAELRTSALDAAVDGG